MQTHLGTKRVQSEQLIVFQSILEGVSVSIAIAFTPKKSIVHIRLNLQCVQQYSILIFSSLLVRNRLGQNFLLLPADIEGRLDVHE
jgi:hypothetical protein